MRKMQGENGYPRKLLVAPSRPQSITAATRRAISSVLHSRMPPSRFKTGFPSRFIHLSQTKRDCQKSSPINFSR